MFISHKIVYLDVQTYQFLVPNRKIPAAELLYIFHNNCSSESYEIWHQCTPIYSKEPEKNCLSIAAFCVLQISVEPGMQFSYYYSIPLHNDRSCFVVGIVYYTAGVNSENFRQEIPTEKNPISGLKAYP